MVIPKLIPIINLDTLCEPLNFFQALLNAGLRFFQIRGKMIHDYAFLERSRRLVGVARIFTQQTNVPVTMIINDRIDICLLTQADGVHLGQDDIEPETARRILGNQACIGASSHSLEQLIEANETPVDYIAFGPIFPSSKKSGHANPLGPNLLQAAAKLAQYPLVAIGGINHSVAQSVYESGASSIAVISDLENSENVEDTIRAYQQAQRAASRTFIV